MDRLRRFFPKLGDDDVAELIAAQVSLAHGRTSSLAELLAGWAAHVDRLGAEAQRADEQVDSWTEHDYVAALHIRDQVEQAMLVAGESAKRVAVRYLDQADGRFHAMTTPDDEHLLNAVVGPGERGDGWWWARIPSQGPVRDGLVRLAGRGDR